MWEIEISTVFFYFLTQMFRIMLGSEGNRTEHKFSTLFFVVFTIFTLLFGIYFSFLTTYVLLIEIVVGTVGIFFALMEIVSGIIAFILFLRAEKR
mmetsp:Transcript_7829/g.5874  ORF Transcript_7829/g.5874 Transcript_7829/m.5874 type:complete len:95 (-) Transcript_7829:54-338(-)